MPQVIINGIKINLWPPMGLIFRIWAGFARGQFLDDLGVAKNWSQKSKKSEKWLRGDARLRNTIASWCQGGGRGGGKPPPGLGGLGGSEDRKEDRFGGSEERGSERRKVRRIRRTQGALHADPMGRRI